MRRAAHAFFLALALTAAASAVFAASGLTVGINESRRVLLRGPAANVIVGDPQIADVAVVDAHSLLVMGRGYGATDLVVLDQLGRTLFDGRVTVSAPEENRLTVHRGIASTDFSCSPRCQALPGGAAAAASSSGGASDAPSVSASSAPSGVPMPTSISINATYK